VLAAVSNGMWTVKLAPAKSSQFLTGVTATQVVLYNGRKTVAVGHNLSQIRAFDEVYNICAS